MTEAAASVPAEQVTEAIEAGAEGATAPETSGQAKEANGSAPVSTEEVEKACKKQGELHSPKDSDEASSDHSHISQSSFTLVTPIYHTTNISSHCQEKIRKDGSHSMSLPILHECETIKRN
jgi:hypothetical protein